MINFQNLVKKFVTPKAEVVALNKVNLSINDGEIFGIIGLSGAGKSTLLRTINGLEIPDSGDVVVNDTRVNSLSELDLLNYRKEIGMIFQHFNLFNSKTVRNNIAFPLELLKWSKEEIDERVTALASWIGLEEKLDAYPSQLSGGQKQRVAIARALANHPKILLCDEATSALDPLTTENILNLLKKINEEFGVTIVLITHELSVVEAICDRFAVMENGVITQINSASALSTSQTNAKSLYQKIS